MPQTLGTKSHGDMVATRRFTLSAAARRSLLQTKKKALTRCGPRERKQPHAAAVERRRAGGLRTTRLREQRGTRAKNGRATHDDRGPAFVERRGSADRQRGVASSRIDVGGAGRGGHAHAHAPTAERKIECDDEDDACETKREERDHSDKTPRACLPRAYWGSVRRAVAVPEDGGDDGAHERNGRRGGPEALVVVQNKGVEAAAGDEAEVVVQLQHRNAQVWPRCVAERQQPSQRFPHARWPAPRPVSPTPARRFPTHHHTTHGPST